MRLQRKQAQTVAEVIREYLHDSGLTSGMNTHRIFTTWDDVSGAGKFTARKFFRDGKLYITVSSSVVRSQLLFQKQALLEKMNERLASDVMFNREDTRVGFIKELIIK